MGTALLVVPDDDPELVLVILRCVPDVLSSLPDIYRLSTTGMGLITIRDIIAELNRQAAEHQAHRLLLIKQITTDPAYQVCLSFQCARTAFVTIFAVA